MYHPTYGGGMGAYGGGGMGGYPSAGMPSQWGGHGGGHRDDGHSLSGQSEIDKLVTTHKNQRDSARIENWCVPPRDHLSDLREGYLPMSSISL